MRASQPAILGAMAPAFASLRLLCVTVSDVQCTVHTLLILSRCPVCYMVSCVERFVFVGRTVQPRWMT